MDRLEAYNNLPEVLKPLYEGTDKRLRVLDELVAKLNLSPQQKKALVNYFGDTVLGIAATQSFPQRLRETFSQSEVTQIVSEFEPLIAFVERHSPHHVPDTTTVQQPGTASVETVKKSTDEANTSDEKDTTVTPEKVTPMRTMADDMQRVHGYGAMATHVDEAASSETETEPVHHSSQEHVLQRPQVAQTPQYTTDTAHTATTPPEATPKDEAPDTRWSSNYEDAEGLDKPTP